jgi:hypothetical protein
MLISLVFCMKEIFAEALVGEKGIGYDIDRLSTVT